MWQHAGGSDQSLPHGGGHIWRHDFGPSSGRNHIWPLEGAMQWLYMWPLEIGSDHMWPNRRDSDHTWPHRGDSDHTWAHVEGSDRMWPLDGARQHPHVAAWRGTDHVAPRRRQRPHMATCKRRWPHVAPQRPRNYAPMQWITWVLNLMSHLGLIPNFPKCGLTPSQHFQVHRDRFWSGTGSGTLM